MLWARDVVAVLLVSPKIGVSPERQLEVHKDTILQQWFEQRSAPAQG